MRMASFKTMADTLTYNEFKTNEENWIWLESNFNIQFFKVS